MIQSPVIKWKGAAPGNWEKDRDGFKPEALVLHITDQVGGGLAALDNWFNNPAAGVSAHFGVGKAGEVHGYVNVHDTAFANGKVEQGYTAKLIDENPGVNPNSYLISIEHEGRTGETLTPAQWVANTRLAAYLCESVLLPHAGSTGFAITRDRILMHRDITPKTRDRCPGWGEAYQEAYINEVARILGGEGETIREFLNGYTAQARELRKSAHTLRTEAGRLEMQADHLDRQVDRFR